MLDDQIDEAVRELTDGVASVGLKSRVLAAVRAAESGAGRDDLKRSLDWRRSGWKLGVAFSVGALAIALVFVIGVPRRPIEHSGGSAGAPRQAETVAAQDPTTSDSAGSPEPREGSLPPARPAHRSTARRLSNTGWAQAEIEPFGLEPLNVTLLEPLAPSVTRLVIIEPLLMSSIELAALASESVDNR